MMSSYLYGMLGHVIGVFFNHHYPIVSGIFHTVYNQNDFVENLFLWINFLMHSMMFCVKMCFIYPDCRK